MKKPASSAISFAFSIFLATISYTVLPAQPTTVPTINQQQHFQVKSKTNGKSYSVSVSLPQNYSKSDTVHYPVLYMLDGNSAFPVAHAARQMMDLTSALEDVIIVTIGYEWEKSFQPWFTTRWNDLTPTPDTKADTSMTYLALLKIPKGRLISGDAGNFFNVIKNDLFPFIQKRYKTNNDRGIYGHSLGGLFVMYCLLSEPGVFQRYGISSPSVWWHNRRIFEVEKSFSLNHHSLPGRVFMSVGSLEGPVMTSGMTDFADSLKAHNYSGLSLTTQVFDNETHFSVFPASISRTLRVLYSRKAK